MASRLPRSEADKSERRGMHLSSWKPAFSRTPSPFCQSNGESTRWCSQKRILQGCSHLIYFLRLSRKEAPHADRLCASIHPGPESRPAEESFVQGGMQENVRRQGQRHASRTARTGRDAGTITRRRHAGGLEPGPPGTQREEPDRSGG